MSAPEYDPFAPPGRFDHGGTDCKTHGDNVAGFKLHKAGGPRFCVACALDLLRPQEPAQPATLGAAFASSVEQRARARRALYGAQEPRSGVREVPEDWHGSD